MKRRRAIVDRGRKRRMVTVDTRNDRRAEQEGARLSWDRPALQLEYGHPERGVGALGCYQMGRLPTADEQATGRDPYDEDA